MIRCLAVDDEAYAAEIIAGFVRKTPFLELVGISTSALEALHLVQEDRVDLVFLDIQMPDLSGIQFLKAIGNRCKVVLTTAYPDYALEGYDLDVVDYLMKPIPFERFLRAAHKAQTLIGPSKLSVGKDVNQERDYLFVKGDSKHKFIKIGYADIRYIEGLKNYVSIYTDKDRMVTYTRLADLEVELPSPPFHRIHKSYIISIKHVKGIEGHQVQIADRYLPIGESYRKDFYSCLKRDV